MRWLTYAISAGTGWAASPGSAGTASAAAVVWAIQARGSSAATSTRIWALWGLVAVAPEACSTGAVTLLAAGPAKLQLNYVSLMMCWSISEILRYGFYAAKVR